MAAMPEKPLVLVIDDEAGSRESMAIALEKAGQAVRTFDDARQALAFMEEDPNRVQLAVCDLRMPDLDGLAFLEAVREAGYPAAVMLVTAYGSIDSAVEAMRVGADDYLTKPVDLYELRTRVTNLIEKHQLREEVTSLRAELDKRYGFESIIGNAPVVERLFEQMGWSPRRARRCWWSARAAPARSWWPTPCTTPARGAPSASWRSTAAPSPRTSSKASCSATSAARSPARWRARSASSSSPTAAPCSSTRSASCTPSSRSSCSACSSSAR
jgi:FixJ family two-component response regulator